MRFVEWDRVGMSGEYESAAPCADARDQIRFAGVVRQRLDGGFETERFEPRRKFIDHCEVALIERRCGTAHGWCADQRLEHLS